MLLYIIIALLSMLLGGYFGYRLGALFTSKENTMLKNQVTLLRDYSQYWGTMAAQKHDLAQQVAQQQTTNVSSTIQTVVQLLHTFQREAAATLNNNEKHVIDNAIDQIITQAQAITDERVS